LTPPPKKGGVVASSRKSQKILTLLFIFGRMNITLKSRDGLNLAKKGGMNKKKPRIIIDLELL